MAGLSTSAFWFSPECKTYPGLTGGFAGFPANKNRGEMPPPGCLAPPWEECWAFET